MIPEYQVDFGVVDYALLGTAGQPGNALAFIEAKRMVDDLNDDHREQLLAYAGKRRSVKYAVLTNGDLWEMYEISGYTELLKIHNISIMRQPAWVCAQELKGFFSRLPIATTKRTSGKPRREDAHADFEHTEVHVGRGVRNIFAKERLIQAPDPPELPEHELLPRQEIGFDPTDRSENRTNREFSRRGGDASLNSTHSARGQEPCFIG